MYRIIKDVASIITTSSQKDRSFLKTKNQHRTLHLDPQQTSLMVNRNRISGIVVPNCMNIPKYTLIGYISLSNGGWSMIM